MRSLRGQRGLSSVGWIALLIVVGFAAIAGIRIVPAYLDYYSVVSSAKSAHNKGALEGLSTTEVRETLRKQMRINNVDDIGDRVVSIKRSRGGIEMVIDYEVREPLIGNVDVILRFNRTIGS